MQTSQGIDYSTLSWVRPGIDETLAQAQDGLESFVQDRQDKPALQACVDGLHQIQGTLTMMQTASAARLAEEMEATANALIEGNVPDTDEAIESLMRSILQLPDYLEWLQSGKPDRPQVLKPLIDDLRVARNEAVSAPTTHAVGTPTPVEAKPDQEVRTLARRVRPLYQSGLVHLLRDTPDEAGTRRMLQALDMLARTCRRPRTHLLWTLAGGHLEAATTAGTALALPDKRLLGQIDREMKRLADDGEQAQEDSPNTDLIDNLGALIQAGETGGQRTQTARALLQATQAEAANSDEGEGEEPALSGVNAQVLETVSAAIREDLSGIKDSLDLYARDPQPDVRNLGVLSDPLRKIADTLNVIGLRSARAVVTEMGNVIGGAVDQGRNLPDPAQLEMATAVLFVETALNALSEGRGEATGDADEVLNSLQRISDPDQGEERRVFYAALPDAEFQQVTDAVMREAHIDIGRSKDAIAAFIDSPYDTSILSDAPELFTRISGALGLMNQLHAAQLTDGVRIYLDRKLLSGRELPERAELENLADAISAIEYFLEAKQLKRRDADQVLDVAERSLNLLGYPFAEEAPEPGTSDPAEEILDDETFLADLPDVDDLVPEPPAPTSDAATSTPSSEIPASVDINADAEPADATPEVGPETPDQATAPAVTVTDLVSSLPALDGDADEDILDIFLEEAAEERDRIAALLPAWRNDADNVERVAELRRAYHTLKGSGRMVGAARLGEFSWFAEDLLNRVMDGGVEVDERLLDTVEEASNHALPELIARLSDDNAPMTADVDLIAARLIALRNRDSNWPERSEVDVPPNALPAAEAPTFEEEIVSEPISAEAVANEISEAADDTSDIGSEPELINEPEPIVEAEDLPDAAGSTPDIDESDIEEVDYAGLGEALSSIQPSADSPEIAPTEGLEPDLETAAEKAPEAADLLAETPPEAAPAMSPDEFDDSSEETDSSTEQAENDDDQLRLDPVLYEIFSKEMLGHLDTLDAFVASARERGFPGKPSAELRRSLHTILGSTRTTGITELADLAGPLDTYIKDAGVNEEPLTESDLELLTASAQLFRDSVTHLNDPQFVFPDIGPLVDGISQAFAERTRLRAEGPTETDHETILGVTEEDLADSEPEHEDDADARASDSEQVDDSAPVEDSFVPETELGEPPPADAELPVAEDLAPFEMVEEFALDSGDDLSAEASDESPLDMPVETGQEPAAEPDIKAEIADVDIDLPDSPSTDDAATPALDSTAELAEVASDVDTTLEPDDEASSASDDSAEANASSPADTDDIDQPSGFQVDTDADLLDLFLEESAEILDAAEGDLNHLQRRPDDHAIIESLERGLHTLKGGARMAGLTPIGDLSHALETLFEAMGSGKVQADDAAIQLLNQCFDRLINMSVETRSRGAISSGDDLIQSVDALTRGERIEVPVDLPEAERTENVGATGDDARAMPELSPIDDVVAGLTPDLSSAISEPVDETPETIDSDATPGATTEPAESAPTAPARAEPSHGKQIRVRAEALGNLVNLAGEVSIFRSRLEQQLGSFQFNITELDQTVSRVRDQLRKLEIETEAQILSRYHKESHAGDSNFDPLELDRFSQLQQLSRALSEGINDLLNIQGALDGLTGETETLLRQQSRVNTELQEGLMGLRMVPFTSVEPRLRRIVRQTAQELGKKVELNIVGGGSEIDRTILERMTAPLEHMLRNAVSHGIEPPELRRAGGKPEFGSITLRLAREGADVVIEVRDDGAGVNLDKLRHKAIERGLLGEHDILPDYELMQLLLESGFSTADSVSQIAGRGVGMDVVRSEVRQLSGTLDINSLPGRGAWFTIRLPFTLSVNKALLITVGDDPYAIPLAALDGVIRLNHEVLQRSYGSESPLYEYAGNSYSLMHLGKLLGSALPVQPDEHDRVPVLLVRAGDRRVALQVDGLVGSREIVVKSLGVQLANVPGIAGATILGDGRVVLILELGTLVRIGRTTHQERLQEVAERKEREEPRVSVMVVDDSITMRKVATRLLERHNVHVLTAKDGIDALSQLQDMVPDVMLLDIEMPRMDGFELASHMRRDDRLKNVPIVMITSRTGDKHRERATEIGINEYMGKPYKENDLLQTILGLAHKPATQE